MERVLNIGVNQMKQVIETLIQLYIAIVLVVISINVAKNLNMLVDVKTVAQVISQGEGK